MFILAVYMNVYLHVSADTGSPGAELQKQYALQTTKPSLYHPNSLRTMWPSIQSIVIDFVVISKTR